MKHWLAIILLAIALLTLTIALVIVNKRALARALLSLPGLRRLGLNLDLARLTRSLSLLLHAGVPLDETLILAKRAVRRRQVIEVIERMQHNIEAGRPLGTGLRKTKGVIPTMMARSIETAETAGTLEQTLQRLAEHFDAQVAESFKALSSLLEPLMIVIVGGMVGLLMITVIAPIYNLISQFKPKYR